jgi:hypothetical protein
MQSYREQDQIYTFPDGWDVLHYDNEGHRQKYLADYNAVDFVARSPQGSLVFLEIKDYRGYERQNREKLQSGELARLIHRKVLMTYAGLIAGCRHDSGDNPFRRFAPHLTTCPELKVVALIDAREPRLGAPLDVLLPNQVLKKALRGLGVHSLVCTPDVLRRDFGITCQNLSRPALVSS